MPLLLPSLLFHLSFPSFFQPFHLPCTFHLVLECHFPLFLIFSILLPLFLGCHQFYKKKKYIRLMKNVPSTKAHKTEIKQFSLPYLIWMAGFTPFIEERESNVLSQVKLPGHSFLQPGSWLMFTEGQCLQRRKI